MLEKQFLARNHEHNRKVECVEDDVRYNNINEGFKRSPSPIRQI